MSEAEDKLKEIREEAKERAEACNDIIDKACREYQCEIQPFLDIRQVGSGVPIEEANVRPKYWVKPLPVD